jgi:sialate O-acetylesterase
LPDALDTCAGSYFLFGNLIMLRFDPCRAYAFGRLPRWRQTVPATVLLVVVLFPALASAAVGLPAVFGKHMVLQRGRPVPVWGTAAAGESVSVSFAGQAKSTTADKNGRWKISLDSLQAGGPHTLVVKGSNEVTIADVLVGEVWLASGQSNMAMTVRRCRDADTEQAAADFPRIRMFTVRRNAQLSPQQDFQGTWAVCSPETVGKFSGAAYFFGRRLHRELKVPVGLVNSSWGGTAIEAWTSLDVQEKDARLASIFSRWKDKPTADRNRPANLYNGMIEPLVGYGIRGAIWYQGERNSRSPAAAMLYRHQLPLLINDWRKRWGQGAFPFLWVQLPNFKARRADPNLPSSWALIRESMQHALRQPATGMAVTIDIGEARNIHPKNKQDVGHRLAQAGLALAYGRSMVGMGPLMRSVTIEDSRVRVQFGHVGRSLVIRGKGEAVKGFALAGPDRRFHPAEARIEGKTVVTWSKAVTDPIAVRYAFSDNPEVNLYNAAGIPAAPFRTDEWEIGTGR